MRTTRHGLRPLGPSDLADLLALTDRDPIVNVFADYRARHHPARPALARRRGVGPLRGRRARLGLPRRRQPRAGPGTRTALAPSPNGRSPGGRTVLHDRRARRTPCGPLWQRLARRWGPPRETRWHQPHLEIAGAPAVAPDPLVRRTEPTTSTRSTRPAWPCTPRRSASRPEFGGGADLYRARVNQLVDRGWSFARYERGPRGLQGRGRVRVAVRLPGPGRLGRPRPPRRGPGRRRHGRGGASSRCGRSRRSSRCTSTSATLPARAAYARVGFEQTGTFSTIMF